MSLAVDLMMTVCREQNLPYNLIGDNKAVLKIKFPDFDHIILNAALGLNTDAQMKLAQDKYYSYQLLSNAVPMPKTVSYIDPDTFGPFKAYITFLSNQEILADLESKFSYPVIIKRNSGTQGENVFLCHNRNQAVKAIEAIYSKQQIEYDHVCLAQDYVAQQREYRVIILDGKVELAYLKDISKATFIGNLSPLHWQNATSHVVGDEALVAEMQIIASKLHQVFPIRYAGLDIIEDVNGKLWLLEINSTPQFGEFVKLNDPVYFKRIFEKALRLLADGKR